MNRDVITMGVVVVSPMALGLVIDYLQPGVPPSTNPAMVFVGVGILLEIASIVYYSFGRSGFPAIAPFMYFLALIAPERALGPIGMGSIQTALLCLLLLGVHVAIHFVPLFRAKKHTPNQLMPPRRANPPYRIIVAPYGMDNLEGCRLAWAEDPDELDAVVDCGVWRKSESKFLVAYADLITIDGLLAGIAFRPHYDIGDKVCERLIADGLATDDGWGASCFFNPLNANSPLAETDGALWLTELFFDKKDRPLICILLGEIPRGLGVSRDPAHAFDLLPFTPLTMDQ